MTLDPHHLQQWDRSVQAAISARVGAVCRYDWGLTHLDVDEDRLANGEFALRAVQGVLPDGTPFRFPDDAPLPPARELRDALAPTAERLRVFLAVPALRLGGTNVLLDEGQARREARYTAEDTTATDDTTGADAREIRVARLNARVLFDGESREEAVCLAVAEVVRAADGTFALDGGFVAPSLRVGAARALAALAARVTERLAARTTALATRWQAVRHQREISPGDVTAQALLAATAEYAPRVDHLRRTDAHPEALFCELLGLAGRLWAAAPGTGPAPHELPTYDHAEPTAPFRALSEAIEQLLGGKAPRQNYARVAMVQRRPNLFEAALGAEVLHAPGLVLSVRRAGLSPEHLKASLPQMLRIASPETIDAVVRSYTHALVIDPLATPPTGLPVDPQAAYFQPRRRGPFWDAIAEAGAIALFTPAEFADAEFEILAPQPG
jgi:type VI secretion system protein ImpJ